MGGHAWTYFVPYQPDILAAMLALRRREFEAGRYNPAVRFPMDRNAPSPGAQHASIEAALEATDRYAVTVVGAPSYASGAHMWNGTLATLKPVFCTLME